MAPTSAPSQREIALLTLLLISLLYFFSGTHPHATLPSTASLSSQTDDDTSAHSSRLSWHNDRVPHTKLIAHVPGWTLFDRLYMLNGTLYIVTDTPSVIPERRFIISTGRDIANGAEEVAARLPTDKELKVIGSNEAKRLFGGGANRIDGVTWFANDPKQFVTHYYHWAAELFFGFARAYAALDPLIPSDGTSRLPPPRRMIFTHLPASHWRDYASMNQWVLRTAFPSVAMEFNQDWSDRSQSLSPFVFDRIIIADRSAAMIGDNFGRTQRTASEPQALPGSPHWWNVYRNNIIETSGLERDEGAGTLGKPVVTYISRQGWGRRMLIQEDHERLVEELYKLRDMYGWEVNVVLMDKMSRAEQLRLSGRTTIMLGVHGNGLTSLLWMKPTPRSTVMEFFFPGGFAHDYEYTTRALGMMHYGFWGDSAFTRPDVPPVAYPDGFQGNEIPIDGALVARLIHERLTLSDEADD
ncbi:hypothetical protein PENSPDRAFT_635987 [Peniophora sp. CONT]|nr:hypothetical protein PENSPDRAFT_635987 [Peniophora sp. CONT]